MRYFSLGKKGSIEFWEAQGSVPRSIRRWHLHVAHMTVGSAVADAHLAGHRDAPSVQESPRGRRVAGIGLVVPGLGRR